MDNEKKAKVEELLKNFKKRELSMDELDKVNGGLDSGFYFHGEYVSADELYETGRMLTNAFGYDVAADFLCQQYDINPNEKSMDGNKSNIERIDLLVHRILLLYD